MEIIYLNVHPSLISCHEHKNHTSTAQMHVDKWASKWLYKDLCIQ